MDEGAKAARLFVAQVRFGDWLDNLYLAGPASESGAAQFEECLRLATPEASGCKDWRSHRAWAIAMFEHHGFLLTKK